MTSAPIFPNLGGCKTSGCWSRWSGMCTGATADVPDDPQFHHASLPATTWYVSILAGQQRSTTAATGRGGYNASRIGGLAVWMGVLQSQRRLVPGWPIAVTPSRAPAVLGILIKKGATKGRYSQLYLQAATACAAFTCMRISELCRSKDAIK